MNDRFGYLVAAGLFVLALWLITQRWFWMLAFFTGGLASCFAMLASIIYFQILGALGFFFLMAICWGALFAIIAVAYDAYEEKQRFEARIRRRS
jgi:hypothetical protein